jgi:hypothetical protein
MKNPTDVKICQLKTSIDYINGGLSIPQCGTKSFGTKLELKCGTNCSGKIQVVKESGAKGRVLDRRC